MLQYESLLGNIFYVVGDNLIFVYRGVGKIEFNLIVQAFKGLVMFFDFKIQVFFRPFCVLYKARN